MNRIQNSSFFNILLGFALYESGVYFLSSYRILTFTMVGIGLTLIFFNLLFNKNIYIPFEQPFNAVFSIFLIYSIFIIVRPLIFHGDNAVEMFTSFYNQYYWSAFLLPLIVFLGKDKLSINFVYKFIYIYFFLGMFFILLNLKDIINPPTEVNRDYHLYVRLINTPKDLLFVSSFTILTFYFVTKKYKKIALLGMIIGLLLVTVAARRAGVFTFLLMFTFSFYIYVFKSGQKNRSIKLLFVFVIILVSGLIFFMYSDSLFSMFFARLEVDSRGAVEKRFYADFQGKTIDWIFGRGLNGAYYCPGIEEHDYRMSIETGYLFLILKGGILYLALFIYVLLKAAYYGFFRTNNRMTQGMALYIVAHLIFLIPFGIPSFSFEYIIVWISVLYCMSSDYRKKTDTEIIESLNML